MSGCGPSHNAGGDVGDNEDEMLRRHRLDDRTADAVLGGHAQAAELADLAAFLTAVRTEAVTGPARPSASLVEVLTEGISADGDELPVPAPRQADEPATWVARPPRRRRLRALELVTVKLAALSIAAKAGVAGAAVVATTAGAGAAGALPDTLQIPFDNIMRGGHQTEEERDSDGPDAPDDAGSGDVDTAEDGVTGADMADDTTHGGDADAEVAEDDSSGPSSEGREHAEDAEEGAPGLPDEADRGELPDEANRDGLPDEANRGKPSDDTDRDELPNGAGRSERSDEADRDEVPGEADRGEPSDEADASTGVDTADSHPDAPEPQPRRDAPSTDAPSTQDDDTEAPVQAPAADDADARSRSQSGP